MQATHGGPAHKIAQGVGRMLRTLEVALGLASTLIMVAAIVELIVGAR
jgi:hypothetical protein